MSETMKQNRFPRYSLKMRGTEAIKIIYEGQDLGTFDLAGLWEEYRKTIDPNDVNKRYVIERAIEVFEGKVPRVYKRGRSGNSARGEFVPMWNPVSLGRAPARYPVEKLVRAGKPPARSNTRDLLGAAIATVFSAALLIVLTLAGSSIGWDLSPLWAGSPFIFFAVFFVTYIRARSKSTTGKRSGGREPR